MIGGVTHQGGLPALPDRVTLSAGVKFCHVNVSRWGNPPSWGRIRDTSNSRKIRFGGGFASSLACVASVSVRFRSKERGTRVKDRATNGASKRPGRGGEERKETLADKPRDFENHPLGLSCLSSRTDI